jgi:hypothetical protein
MEGGKWEGLQGSSNEWKEESGRDFRAVAMNGRRKEDSR